MKNIFRIITFLTLFILLSGSGGCGGLAGMDDIGRLNNKTGIAVPSGQQLDESARAPQNDNSPLTLEEAAALTDIWANALKNRDVKARYEVMSEDMQKNANYNTIGDPDFLVCKSNGLVSLAYADTIYYLIDAFGNKYISEERLTFAREKGRPVVTGCDTKEAVWEREYRFMPTAEAAYYAMAGAIFYEDYYGMLSLAHKEEYNKKQKEYLLLGNRFKKRWGHD